MFFCRTNQYFLIFFANILLWGCGGDDNNPSPISPSYQQGVFAPSSDFINSCLNPRIGNAPWDNQPYPDKQGILLDELQWLRSMSHERYLWYRELPDVNPALHQSTTTYFALLKTTATTNSGKDRDQFHFTLTTADYFARTAGVSSGYGMQYVLLSNRPPRDIRIAYVIPNTPAAQAGIRRGDKITAINGSDTVNGSNVDFFNAALFPSAPNVSYQFTLQSKTGTVRTETLTSRAISTQPVLVTTTMRTIDSSNSSSTIGYLLFTTYGAHKAEAQLYTAFNQFMAESVTDLVLDLRYNSGGFVYIASQLAYMIAGTQRTNGKLFSRLRSNDKLPDQNVDFLSTGSGLSSISRSTALPSLNLSRVFILTGSNTCSASEETINGLLGIGVEVIQIGNTTCGKPFGFSAQHNCGTSYFTIDFVAENNNGFSDYADGFSPVNTITRNNAHLPGCMMGDDFSRPLGDPQEARLAAALQYRHNRSCPTNISGELIVHHKRRGSGQGALSLPAGQYGMLWENYGR